MADEIYRWELKNDLKTSKSMIAKNIVLPGFIVVAILIMSLYISGSLEVQSSSTSTSENQAATSGLQDSFVLASNVNFSTRQTQPPPNANIQQLKEDAYWPNVDEVKNNSQFLVFGTVYGIWNTTARDIGANVIGVFTFFVFHVNQSLSGNLSTGQLIMVMQQGGLSFPSNTSNQYLNQTFDSYPLLEVHFSYVLALSKVFRSALVLYGPYSIYPVRGGFVYSGAPSPPSGLNDVSLSAFLTNWNKIGNSSGSCCPVVTSSSTK